MYNRHSRKNYCVIVHRGETLVGGVFSPPTANGMQLRTAQNVRYWTFSSNDESRELEHIDFVCKRKAR